MELYGAVWTLYRPEMQHKVPKPQSADKGVGTAVATSRRSERSAQRLKDFQAAVRFQMARFLRRWKQIRHQLAQLLPPPQPSIVPPPPSQPTTKLDTWTRRRSRQRSS